MSSNPYIGRIVGLPVPKPTESDRKPKRRRRTPWSLARLFRESRFAPAVWLALQDLSDARGAVTVTPTRDELIDATGIRRLPTISAALTALERGGWIDRSHVPLFQGGKQIATMLRISLRRRSERKPLATNVSP